jgi:hypothetical protein
MGKRLTSIEPELAAWMAGQHVFFVGTAPLAQSGHINLSPKGGDAFRILGPMEVAYQDYTGSGAETAAHLGENGRIVIMFCAFAGPPKIVRLHGRGQVVTPGQAQYANLAAHFPANPGTRAIIQIAVTRVSSSCGFGVPLYDLHSPRETLEEWAKAKGPDGLAKYRELNNQTSIDGLPALPMASELNGL